MRLNHTFPLTPLSRAISIFSLQTPRWALWRRHRTSSACVSVAGTCAEGASRCPSLEGSTFLPPFAPSELPDFDATMAALTPAGSLATSCSGRSPVFTALPFPDIRPPTTPTASKTSSVSRRSGLVLFASRLRLSLAGSSICCGRIVFTFVAVCQVLIRCSPPRLAATQLLQVLTRNTVPDGRGLPPRRVVPLHSACVADALVSAQAAAHGLLERGATRGLQPGDHAYAA